MDGHGIGDPTRRKEDFRFITGQGTYTADIDQPGQLYAHIVRSTHAHARLKEIDAASASGEGVAAVFTGTDMARDDIGGLPCGWQVIGRDGQPMVEPPHPPLAVDRVRHVGDNVAVILAEGPNQAKDAAERLDVTYEPLPAVTSATGALAEGAPSLWEEAADNVCFDWEIGDAGAVTGAFNSAAHVTELDLINNRLIPNAIEPRAAVGVYDSGTDRYTLYTTSQNPHVIRLLMGAYVLKVSEHKLRVVAPDVGGGFGSKIYHYAEEAIVAWAAKKVGRPVKWTAERSESFMTDAHGRDHATTVALALNAEGKFLGLKVDTLANLGAYLSTFAPCIPTYLYATLLAGLYTTPAIHARVRAVFTNTTPVDAYRGAGRPEACFLIERVIDVAARELGIDPAEIRRRNLIQPEQQPYQTPVALQYDSGDYEKNLDDALKLADYAGFEKRRAEAAAQSKLRGIGLSAYIEACGIAPSAVAGALGARVGLYEVAQVRVHPTGSVTVFTGVHPHGQGNETTFAQIVSDRLGVPFDAVEVIHGDTDRIPFGMGTYGSRSLAVGGSALVKALDKVVEKGKQIAAHLLEASETDIAFADGVFRVAGTDREKTVADIALAAYVPHNYPIDTLEPGLDETAFYDPKNFTFPNGVHVCEVEIDEETGQVRIARFVVVDDFGKIVNPMIVKGQVHGGIAQGIGQALHEACAYDPETGQLLTGSYMDYAMPRASDLPAFEVTTNETPCPHNPLGAKGAGEAGAIGAPPAVINAVVHALSPLGVRHIDMPATPHRVWQVIRDAKLSRS